MLSVDEAREMIASQMHLLRAERVHLAEASGRVLREPLVTEHDLPAFDRSTFDGYAVSARSAPGTLKVKGEIAAGQAPGAALGPDECARIFTGAPIPSGADAVAMQEMCERRDGSVEVPAIAAGEGVRRRGEDARAGAILLGAGATLGPAGVSLLAQLGQTRPLVAPRPQIFHVSTGDELVPPEMEPGPGQIRDSNSTLVAALVREAGGQLSGRARAGDRLASLVQACAGAGESDVLLISGGASVGDFDFGRAALSELGYSIRFAGVNLRPGKPLIFATRGRQAAFVIPGNPLSHFVCWHVVIRAALDVLISGMTVLELAELRLGGGADLPGHARETWWPAKLALRGGEAIAEPLKWKSSGDITGVAAVNALARVASGSSGVGAGAILPALLI